MFFLDDNENEHAFPFSYGKVKTFMTLIAIQFNDQIALVCLPFKENPMK